MWAIAEEVTKKHANTVEQLEQKLSIRDYEISVLRQAGSCFAVFHGSSNGGQRVEFKTLSKQTVRFAIPWYNMAIRLSSPQELATAI
jgi:hypothetical protein